jgi:Protein of unknown function (DUF2705)
MKNKGLFYIVAISMTIQSFMNSQLLARRYDEFPSAFTFLLGVQPETEYIIFMFWYLVFVSISFYFLGDISESLSGYGKYVLIRNYNKVKWIMIRYGSVAIRLLGFVLLHSIISLLITFILGKGQGPFLDGIIMVTKAIFIYYLTLLVLLSFQMLLELYINPQISMLIVNMYVVFSVLLAGLFFTYHKGELLLYALIPNYSMGLRLDIMSDSSFIIYYPTAMVILLVIMAVILVFSKQKITEKDLF